jgi:hypothetical protein
MIKSYKIPANLELSKTKQKEYEKARNRAFFYAYSNVINDNAAKTEDKKAVLSKN